MRPEKVLITPQVAQALLFGNNGNRKLMTSRVETLAKAMKSEQWIENGDPIHVSKSGRLLNGQHRLEAVIMSGCAYNGVVVYGVDESAFMTYDSHAKRTLSDSSGVQRKTIEIYNIIIRAYKITPNPIMIVAFDGAAIGDVCRAFSENGNTARKNYSRASVRTGFVLVAMNNGKTSEVFAQYKYLVQQDYDSMTDGVKLLSARINARTFSGKNGGQEQNEECASVIKALTSVHGKTKLVTPYNPMQLIRTYVDELVKRGEIPKFV